MSATAIAMVGLDIGWYVMMALMEGLSLVVGVVAFWGLRLVEKVVSPLGRMLLWLFSHLDIHSADMVGEV